MVRLRILRGNMLGRVVALLALPMAGLVAQAPARLNISAANDAKYVIRAPADSANPAGNPIVVNGPAQLYSRGPVTISSADSTTSVHVEASDNGRVVATASAPYVIVTRDSTGRVRISAQSTF